MDGATSGVSYDSRRHTEGGAALWTVFVVRCFGQVVGWHLDRYVDRSMDRFVDMFGKFV